MPPRPAVRLERAIRLRQALALVVGSIVGVAIFVQPAEVARQVGSRAELAAIWVAAGLLALSGALLCAELSSTFRRGGGVYRYLSEAFGPLAGFLWSWALFWTIHTSIVAAVAVVGARSLRSLLPGLALGERPLAVIAILALSAVNVAGVRRGAGLLSGITAIKVAALVLLALAGAWVGGAVAPTAAAAVPAPEAGERSLGGALLAALFTFGGWHLVTFPSREVASPRRTLPRAIVGGFLAVAALYALLNWAYTRVLPLEAIARSPHVAAEAAEAVAGAGGRIAVAAAATVSAFGALAGLVLAGPRTWLEAARDGLAPGWLGAVHPRFRTPHLALAAQAVWASALAATGTYRQLYGRALVVEWAFFALLALAAVVLRRRGLPRRFSTPAWPLLPVAFSATALALIVDRVGEDPRGALLGLLPVVVGLPVYAWLRARARVAAGAQPAGSPS